MITNLKPYTAMKDSGVPWLGEVPKHWNLERIKFILKERVEKGFADEPLLAATQSKGVVRKDQYENRTVVAQKDLHLLKLVRAGDFVISLRSFQGGIEYARQRGIISPAYTITYPRTQESHGFLAWLFKSNPFIENLMLHVTGIRQGQTIDYEKLSRSKIPFPPLSEQMKITRFLDHVEGRIRRYIQAKKRLIRLLEEEKEAIIHHAVTRGLNPDVRLRPAGVEWFGDVPEHWQVVALRRVIRRAVDGPHHSPSYVDDGIPFLSARNIRPDGWSLDDAKYISESDYKEFSKRVVPEPGDVLYTKGGTTGIARAVDLTFRFQVWVHVAVLKVIQSKVRPKFLATALNSPRCYEQSQLLTRGATNQDLGLGRMKDIILPLPPLREQKAILARLAEATRRISNAIHHARKEISLLREYRTRLIADVVTGKLDVRAAAAQLPDVTEDADLIDDDPEELTAEDADLADDPDAMLQEAEA